jgi:hypothetical protein
MSIQVDCPSCVTGDHQGHDPNWGIKPDVIGGQYCGCQGDCLERVRVQQEEFAKWFVNNMAEGPPPLDRKISTHDYFGNVCTGFGGVAECEHIYWSTGAKCRRPPEDHGYVGKHVKEAE